MNTTTSTIQCQACGYQGEQLVAHYGYKWWMLPLAFVVACTGIGLIPVAIGFIILGNRTYNACPECHGQQLSPWAGEPSSESQMTWEIAKGIDDQAFKKNKRRLLAVVLAMLAVVAVFVFVMTRNK